jgi:hypothetical protein
LAIVPCEQLFETQTEDYMPSTRITALVAAATFALIPALTPGQAQTVEGKAGVVLADYYDPAFGYRVHRRGLADIPGDAFAGATGIVDDVLGTPYVAYEGPYASDRMELCARRFRSFDPATGTYTTYSGEQLVCPYLRG